MATGKDFLVGVFDDEEVLIHAVSKIKNHGIKIHEVYSPFPIHGIDDVMGHKPSNLPIAAFIFGMTQNLSVVFFTSLLLHTASRMAKAVRVAAPPWRLPRYPALASCIPSARGLAVLYPEMFAYSVRSLRSSGRSRRYPGRRPPADTMSSNLPDPA